MKRWLDHLAVLLSSVLTFTASASGVSAGESSNSTLLSSASTVEVVPGIAGLTATAFSRADATTRSQVDGWVSQLQAGWTPNRGQIADGSGHPASNVLFSTTIGDAQIYVTTTGISHYFLARHEGDEEGERIAERGGKKVAPDESQVEWSRLDVTLAGARIRSDHVRLEEPLADQGGTNFYLPQCPSGVLDVPTYGKVTFADVYPGIDWVVRSIPGEGVHQDFVVHPGADAALVRLQYAGASAIEVSADQRSLRIRTALGEVREGALNCSQSDGQIPVDARFRVDGNTASLILGAYDRAKPLVIDPPLVWSTYYGGSSWDGPRAIYCDNVKDVVYVVGYTNSPNMPGLNPGGGTFYQGVFNALNDGFIWKFTQAGVRLWATYYGGSSVEFFADCTSDPQGNFYACGYTVSTDFPVQPLAGAYNQGANGGANDAIIVKFDANGVRQWATYYGGSGSEQFDGLTTDASGKLYVCGIGGAASSLTLLNPGGGAYFQPVPGSPVDALILRFSTGGALEWATYYGGKDYDDATGITTSGTDLYITGYTQSPSGFPTLNPGGGAYFQGAYQGGSADCFISRFTLSGVQTWSTLYGGAGNDYGDQPVVDANGNLFVFGDTDSPNLPTLNPGGTAFFQPALAGNGDFYILKFDAANARQWATFYGGTDLEMTGGSDRPLAIDAQGNIYVTGMTVSSDLPVLNPGGGSFYQGTFGGFRDAMIGQFSNNGTMLWSTYLASNLADFGTGVSIGNTGCLFATGESSATNNFVTVNPGFGAFYQAANAGSDDGYITKFCSPNSSCCLDFTCVPVFTQAQCTAMGGTAFYPNQPCSTVVCTINCKICGKKFSDLNRNGVQDVGEPALQGWTIQLFTPNGTLYATTTTDPSGNYCFNNLPCGAWKVGEVQQPLWVQTAPSPSVYSLNLGTGTTQNGVDFANYSCGTTVGCPPAPPKLAAWWPFDFSPGATSASDATHLSPPRNTAELHLDASGGSVPGLLCLNSPTDYARVPNADQLGLQFAGGSFSIAAWLNVASSTVGPRAIVEKRIKLSGTTFDRRGWALYLVGTQSHLELGTGEATQDVAGPAVTPDTWSHLAVSIDRATHHGRWYLNGSPVAALDFVPIDGLVSSNADLYMGQVSPAFGTAPAFQGCIGDLALFAAPLDAATASKAAATGPGGWCPEWAAMPAVTSICQSQASTQVCFNICNNYPTAQSYHWSLAGLPVGPGCTVAGPTLFSPPAGVVTVAAGSCSPPICVTITRPAGLIAQNATSCFALTFINDATGACRVKTGTLHADNSCWCATPIPSGLVSLAPGVVGATIGIGIHAPCDPPTALAYQIRAVWLDPTTEDPLALGLNGLPPGTPVTGTLNSGRGSEQQLFVNATLPGGYDAAARYEVVVEADVDADGVVDPLCGTVVAPTTYNGTELVGVTPGSTLESSVRLLTSPNPFVAGTTIRLVLLRPEVTELGIFDLGGRLVRRLQRGQLAAGPHGFEWNGRDDTGRRAPAGVYFVSLDGPDRRLQARLVKLQ